MAAVNNSQNYDSSQLEKLIRSHLDSETKRLDRIEAKIDRLSETVVSLARVEEKVASLDKEAERTNERLDKIDQLFTKMFSRLERVEKQHTSSDVTVQIINKMFWIIATSVIGAIAAYFFHLTG